MTTHPVSGQKLGATHWIEFLTAGDWTFTDAAGNAVTYTSLAAGASYAIQVTKIASAPAGAKFRAGWP